VTTSFLRRGRTLQKKLKEGATPEKYEGCIWIRLPRCLTSPLLRSRPTPARCAGGSVTSTALGRGPGGDLARRSQPGPRTSWFCRSSPSQSTPHAEPMNGGSTGRPGLRFRGVDSEHDTCVPRKLASDRAHKAPMPLPRPTWLRGARSCLSVRTSAPDSTGGDARLDVERARSTRLGPRTKRWHTN
jgi:hypothetical protein